MRRLRKKFDAPKQLWNRDRIEHDKGLLSEYGLQNMKEIWKAPWALAPCARSPVFHETMRDASLYEKVPLPEVRSVYVT